MRKYGLHTWLGFMILGLVPLEVQGFLIRLALVPPVALRIIVLSPILICNKIIRLVRILAAALIDARLILTPSAFNPNDIPLVSGVHFPGSHR